MTAMAVRERLPQRRAGTHLPSRLDGPVTMMARVSSPGGVSCYSADLATLTRLHDALSGQAATRPRVDPPRTGDAFVLPQSDYAYGIGPVLARITDVHRRVLNRGEPWWHVQADVANGTPERHGGWLDRDLYIREAALLDTRVCATAGRKG